MDLDDESTSNDNTVMIEFYERHLECLQSYPTYTFEPGVLDVVAVKVHNNSLFKYDWRIYAYEMGVKNNFDLDRIEQSAKLKEVLPLYLTMMKTLQCMNANVADIIKAFLKTKRYDILSFLEPYVKKLLENIPDTRVKEFMNAESQLPFLIDEDFNLSSETEVNCETVSSNCSTSTEQSEKPFTIELNPTLIPKNAAIEFSALQKNSACKNHSPEMKSHASSKLSEFLPRGSLPQEIIIPSAPPLESISVFIQHTERDNGVAKQLSMKLKEEGFAATTLSDMEMLIRMDRVGVLHKVFREVDFIVPVVSEEFLQLIDPKLPDDDDTINNRTLYQMINNEYQHNGCVNFRVRPVLVPNMKRCMKLTNNFILNYSFQLWKEYEKLVRILKETKQIMKQYPLMKIKAL